MQILNIGVIKCDSSKADEMEPAVAAAITKAGLWGKIVGKVSDGGANLLKLWRALKKQGGCKAMGLMESYDGTCYTHSLNDMTRDATNSHCRGPDPCPDPSKSKPRPVVTGVKWLSSFNPMESFRKMAKLVTFTKQSSPAQRGLFHCQSMFLLPIRTLPSAVITRFISQAESWRAIIGCKSAINSLFTSPPCLTSDGKPCITKTSCATHLPSSIDWDVIVNALNVIDHAITLVVKSQGLNCDLPHMTISLMNLYVQWQQMSTDLEHHKTIIDDAIGSDLLQMQHNMCYILINEMEPLMAPLLSFVPAQAHVMYGLLLSPRYKELREVDAFWAAAHPGMSKDERKEACLVVVEQYEASLIDLMTTTALFGRVDIVIDDDVGIGENKHIILKHTHNHSTRTLIRFKTRTLNTHWLFLNSVFLVYTCTCRTFNWVAIARRSPGYLRCR